MEACLGQVDPQDLLALMEFQDHPDSPDKLELLVKMVGEDLKEALAPLDPLDSQVTPAPQEVPVMTESPEVWDLRDQKAEMASQDPLEIWDQWEILDVLENPEVLDYQDLKERGDLQALWEPSAPLDQSESLAVEDPQVSLDVKDSLENLD